MSDPFAGAAVAAWPSWLRNRRGSSIQFQWLVCVLPGGLISFSKLKIHFVFGRVRYYWVVVKKGDDVVAIHFAHISPTGISKDADHESANLVSNY